MSKTIEYDDIVMETKDGGTRYTYVKIHNTLGTLSLYLNKKDETAYISDFSVKENHRGKGLGTLLLKKALFICDKQKKKAELHVVRNNTRAITFYKRLGFKEDKAHSTAYVLKMVME